MAVKKGLGKGLDSLITDKVNTKPAASKNNPTPKSEHAADAEVRADAAGTYRNQYSFHRLGLQHENLAEFLLYQSGDFVLSGCFHILYFIFCG